MWHTTYNGYGIYYAIFNTDGSFYAASTVTPSAGVATLGADTSPTKAGASVVWSAGYTRKYPRRVKYFYKSKRVWIPDLSISDIGIPGYIVPAQVTADESTGIYDCNGRGYYVQRPKSTSSCLFDGTGRLGGELGDNNGPAFIDGDLYRHEGDNQGASPIIPLSNTTGSDVPVLTMFFDKLFRGTHGPTQQAIREASMTGTLVGSTPYSVTTSKTWWDGGVTATQSGTATSGGSTSLTDSSKNTADNMQPWGCWFSTDAFAGLGTDPYVGFILEVDKGYSGDDLTVDDEDDTIVLSASHTFTDYEVGSQLVISGARGWISGSYTIIGIDEATSGAYLDSTPIHISTHSSSSSATSDDSWSMTVTYKMPITGFVDHHGTGGVTFSFNDPGGGFAVASGDVWRIKEPYAGEDWTDRILQLTHTDGSHDLLHIRNSDNDSLFFWDTGAVIDVNSQFQILEKSFGGTWQYDAATKDFIVPPDPSAASASSEETEAGTSEGEGSGSGSASGSGDSNESFGSESSGYVLLSNQIEKTFQKTIEPTAVVDYGLSCCGDYLTLELFNEMFDAINLLNDTTAGVGWTSRANPAVAENNFNALGGGGWWGNGAYTLPTFLPGTDNYTDALDNLYADIPLEAVDSGYPLEDDGAPPQCSMGSQTEVVYFAGDPGGPSSPAGNGAVSAGGDAVYAYPVVTLTQAMINLSPTLTCYIYSGIGSGDTPSDTGTTVEVFINADGSTNPTPIGYRETYATFNAHGTGAAYHQWASAATWTASGSAVGDPTIGTKIGNTTVEVNSINIPAPEFLGGYDNTEGDDRNDVYISGYDGYYVQNQIAVVHWTFDHVGA